MINQIKQTLEQGMKKCVDALKHQLGRVRTGRASPTILDGVMVDYYGVPTAMKQVGQVSTPEARLLQIQPFDKTLIPAIEKAILGANLGVTPASDGNLVRIPFPALTEEKRKDIVKEIKKIGEETKVALRNVRRDQNEQVKKLEKDKKISEDESKKAQTEVQNITDKYSVEVDKLTKAKEDEVLKV